MATNENDRIVEREKVVWEMAEVLYRKMEHLAPEGINWNEADETERQFCYHCADALVRRLDLINRYYGWPASHHN